MPLRPMGPRSRCISPISLSGIRDQAFSPDGRQVLFTAGADAARELWIAETDGSGAHRVAGDFNVFEPSWAPPAGAEIVFASQVPDGHPNGIYALDPRSGQVRTILGPTDGVGRDMVSVAPDGSRIAYSEALIPWPGGNSYRVRVVGIDGSGERQLPAPAAATFQDVPVWSNDGTRLALVRGYAAHNEDMAIAIVPADGSSTGVETEHGLTGCCDNRMEWSPADDTVVLRPQDLDGDLTAQILIDPATGQGDRSPMGRDIGARPATPGALTAADQRSGRVPIGVRSAPRRSMVSVTSSPGSRYRPRVVSRTSRRQPEPTVPLPSRSPGRRRTSAEARAAISPNEKWALAHVPFDTSTVASSLVRATVARIARSGALAPAARAEASSSGVTSHGPIDVAKSLPFAGPSRTVVSSRWRSRADQSFSTKYPPIASSPRSAGRSTTGVSIERGHLQLEVQLLRAARRPHRVVGPADLRHVREVEDRQAVPGLGDLLVAAPPHRRDVLLERVEVAERRRAKDRRPEAQLACLEDRVVLLRPAARAEPVHQLAQGRHAQPTGQMLVERRHRHPVQNGVMGSVADLQRRRAAGQTSRSIQCSAARRVQCRGQPPRRSGRRVALADVGDPHHDECTNSDPRRVGMGLRGG